ncbi:ALG8 [Symbiodinium microadriaticum]|nr:ALG8 [Symbiodinium microadriaticum]
MADPDASEILEVRQALAEERALRQALEADLQRSAQIGQELLLKNEELEQVVKEHAEKTAQVARRASVEPLRRACTVPLGPKEATAEEEESDSELPTPQLLRRGRRAGKTVMVEELMSANLSLHDDLMRLKDEQRQAGLNDYVEAREEGIQNVDEEEGNLVNELQHREGWNVNAQQAQDSKAVGVACASFESAAPFGELLLLPLDLYRSTDFEVHRNWLAITHSLPMSEWYFEATSQWTLDYPPAFAYFEWLLSQVAVLVDPAMLQVSNLEYASWSTVVGGDFVLLAGGLAVGGPQTAAVLLWNSALILVDHIHFQYNGMMLGLLLLSAAAIEKGQIYLGALLFCLLLCMKHIFLYVAPVYFVYLLRGHCGASCWPPRLLLGNLIKLGAVVLSAILVLMSPFLSLQQLEQIAQRLFPFGRGLTHAYWAPNCWALYNTFDRVLAKVMGAAGASSSTAGFAEVYESAVLWTVPPRATFILTLLAYCPLLMNIWHCAGPAGAGRGIFATYLALGSAVAFSFGWHVHEKAILMVTIPLLSAPSLSASNLVLSSVACFSVMPLLPHRMMETSIKWLLFLFGGLVEVFLKDRPLLGHAGRWPWILLGASYALLGAYRDFGGHSLLFRGRMEFLPLLLTSAARAHQLEEELEATRSSLHLAQSQLTVLEEANRALRTSQQALDTERAKLASLLEAADARCVHLEQELEQTTLARARGSRKSTGSILPMDDEVVRGEADSPSLAVELEQDGHESWEEALRVDCVKVASKLRTEVGDLSRATASCKAWLVAARRLCDEKIQAPALSGERSDDEAST